MDKQDRTQRELKSFLPGFSYPERSIRANGERDFRAAFASDDKDHITVALEFAEDDSPELSICRSGMRETVFTPREIEKVSAVLNAMLLAVRSYRGNL